jgi:hypothetical protein
MEELSGSTGGNWSRPPEDMPSRNETEGFAKRTRRNLDFILAAHRQHEDVHVVTQVVLSLLGLVVFPFERIIKSSNYRWFLADLEAQGWPHWTYLDGSEPPTDLATLMTHLRHATAHSNVSFSSDSRYLAEVTITFMNRLPKRLGGGTWSACIRGDDLLVFCQRYLEFLEARVG